jgi:hypothetical protein
VPALTFSKGFPSPVLHPKKTHCIFREGDLPEAVQFPLEFEQLELTRKTLLFSYLNALIDRCVLYIRLGLGGFEMVRERRSIVVVFFFYLISRFVVGAFKAEIVIVELPTLRARSIDHRLTLRTLADLYRGNFIIQLPPTLLVLGSHRKRLLSAELRRRTIGAALHRLSPHPEGARFGEISKSCIQITNSIFAISNGFSELHGHLITSVAHGGDPLSPLPTSCYHAPENPDSYASSVLNVITPGSRMSDGCPGEGITSGKYWSLRPVPRIHPIVLPYS